MKFLKNILVLTLYIPIQSFAGGSESGGTGFLFPPGQQVRYSPSQDGGDSAGGGFEALLFQASMVITDGRNDIAYELVNSFDLELAAYFNENQQIGQESSLNQLRSSIINSMNTTVLRNYGGYSNEEAINAVLSQPADVQNEVNQIIYSL